MPWYSELYTMVSHYIFGWRDVAEIALFSMIIYYASLWLKKDKQKNLLLHFYGYCIIVLGAYHAHLPTVSFLLFATAPIAVMLFILIHQDVLQKNFVMLRNIMPATIEQKDWLETLIRTVMVASNNNKTVYCVIEHTHSLSEVISTPLVLHTDLQKNLFTMILESDSFEQDKLLWINSKGRLLGMNATWNSDKHQQWLDHSVTTLPIWQQDALFFTAHTDAIVFNVDPKTRLFSILAQGKIVHDISAPVALKTIEKYITCGHTTAQKTAEIQKEKSREHKKSPSKQRNA